MARKLKSGMMVGSPPKRAISLGVFPLTHQTLADQILQIPLPSTPIQGSYCWGAPKNGLYTIKSGYYYELHASDHQEDTFNASRSLPDFHWQKLWSLLSQPKIKHFVWRLMLSSLPVRSNLVRMGIQVPIFCPWCEEEPEIETHLFRDCSWTKSAWSNSSLGD
ncbi:Reverse transcriptase zinc-binding domain [Sesbania bispinosa]|nr:Reverse transcriptase zinc-binding domain [Sesbania bispinosa]